MQVSRTLRDLIGVEERIDAVNLALRAFAREMRPPVIGAYQISCSDESEGEWVSSFDTHFVRDLLPELKFLKKSAFRTANLGARYEQGALAIAEDHYAGAVAEGQCKLLVVKVHSHVAVVDRDGAPQFGEMVRYGQESAYCGALRALLLGKDTGYTRALYHTFCMGGLDRLAILRAPDRVSPEYQPLFAAIVNTLLQGERVRADILAHKPQSDTVYAIASSVTLNRAVHDTELLCGITLVACRDDVELARASLGDDPGEYAVTTALGKLRVTG